MRRRGPATTTPSAGEVAAQMVEQLRLTCRAVAAGDLEARVPYTDGADDVAPELAALRTELNNVLDRVDGFLRETDGSLAAAEEGRLHRLFLPTGMTGSFRISAARVDRARETMAGYAEQTDQARTARRTLAGDFEETVATVAQQIASAATELSASASGLAHAATSAVTEADQARGTIDTLEDRSRQIEQVVTMISKVAAQTKLLALNATIEAARAGTAGTGFAVVASEVKALADQTEGATAQIIELVNAVQGIADESSKVMGTIVDTVREMSGLTHGVAIAVDGKHDGLQSDGGGYTGLAALTELLRSESDRFLSAMRDT